MHIYQTEYRQSLCGLEHVGVGENQDNYLSNIPWKPADEKTMHNQVKEINL